MRFATGVDGLNASNERHVKSYSKKILKQTIIIIDKVEPKIIAYLVGFPYVNFKSLSDGSLRLLFLSDWTFLM